MIGSTVSRYRILERLGGGGMGVVYKAEDLKLERPVALKFLSSNRSESDADRRRFLREARAASALDHSNICTIYEIDETEEGRLYIAMALCPGETLKRTIESGPLALDEAVDVAAQVAAGLGRAHERGIVHRDVKPANLIVSPAGLVKIVDFGIAHLEGQSRLTRAGAAVGTAAYMAPEVFRGEPADARSDVWSLGVVLYEMLTGVRPFQGEPDAELIESLLHRDPPPMASLRPGMPAALERIVNRALAKRPEDRYAAMEELAGDLRMARRALRESEETVRAMPPRSRTAEQKEEERAGPGLSGRTVSHYQILEQLGGGGMGIVYKAEDTQLGRIVALKFLPPELTRDPEAKARFLQEARAASALDHPNVCTIHEVGETGEGRLFLAMACYDGETLRKRLERGPLPVEEAVDVAIQIARGLAKAHRQGIVHRDVKPANLMITGDEVAKILDFGLAKLIGAAALTRTGTSIGTPAYMSPEQARGDEVDARTDIWSLGVVFYEMLAGRRPFRGEREQAVIYAVLNEEPEPLHRVRPEVPAELGRIVGRMLAKDPARRYPALPDMLFDLQTLYGPVTGTLQTRSLLLGRPRSASPVSRWIGPVIAAAVVAAAVGGGYAWRQLAGDGVAAPAVTFETLTGDQQGLESFPSLSPDGSYFLYTKASGDNVDIYSQRVGGNLPTNLTADSSVADTHPAFSPDGNRIAFRSEREGGGIFVMGATGESPRRITDLGCHNPAWSPDSKEIACATEGVADSLTRRLDSRIWRVDVSTGAKHEITKVDSVQPSWSPHGSRIAYWGVDASGKRVLWTVPAGGGPPVRVTEDTYVNWNPVWSPDGEYLYFLSDRSGSMNLWRVPIDEDSGKARGEPVAITTSSGSSKLVSFAQGVPRFVYVSDESKLSLESFPFDPERRSLAGPATTVVRGTRRVVSGEASPDRQLIAFQGTAPQEDLFVARADGTGVRQLTNDLYKDRHPVWSPRGTELLFYSNRSGRYQAWTIRPDGSDLRQLTNIQDKDLNLTYPLWSPKDSRLACVFGARGTMLIDLDKPLDLRLPQPLAPAGEGEEIFIASSWSPNGNRLAGTLARKGGSLRHWIGVYSFDTRRYEKLIDHGTAPVWLPDNRTLLFVEDGKVFQLDSGTREVRELLAPPPGSADDAVSVSPDGQRIYTVRKTEDGDVWMGTLGAKPD